ncbi:hypothetical protein GCM10022404_21860 [Celeribacter arenosi]|uniref:ParB/Sulfiredoxin domain-containing protein n=1 Tax=Celeribacter arenosi TaxID=792649 RepID=A0ABP7KB05_9RHOB
MPRPKRVFLRPNLISDEGLFEHRAGQISSSHVQTLARTLRANKRLDPIWVWREIDGNGNAKGTYELMDGRHRLSAYEMCFNQRREERYLNIPVYIFEGSEVAAALKALAVNSKDKLALTPTEKLDAAWSIVARDLKDEATKPTIARAAGISERTVLNMRNKRNEFIKAGERLPGAWHEARNWPQSNDWEPPSDAQRQLEIEELAKGFQDAIRTTRSRDVEILAEALRQALGEPKTTFVVDHLHGLSESEYDEWDEEIGPIASNEHAFCLAGEDDF